MTQTPSNAVLLDDALAAIREVAARMDGRLDAALSRDDPAPSAEGMAPSGRAAQQVAIHHYLVSASLLLDASLTLIRQPAQRSPAERARQWSVLIEQTKTAGRMVYGAALALVDPGATMTSTPPPPPRA